MIKIRQANDNDIEKIESLYLKKIRQLALKNIKQWDVEEVTWSNLSRDYDISNFYIAFEKNQMVGVFVIVNYDPTYWLHDTPKEALYLHKIVVDDRVSKQGVSDQILAYFKEEGRRSGYSVVKLDVREYKEKLRSFYERNGFKLVEIVDLQKGYLTALYECRL